MSFSYNPGQLDILSLTRLRCGDTIQAKAVFDDDEINAFLFMTSSQGIFASGQAVFGGTSGQKPPLVQSYRLAAAAAIDVMATDLARRASVEQLLDVKLTTKNIEILQGMAKGLREEEERCGHFAIAEMVPNEFAARDRFVAQALRQTG